MGAASPRHDGAHATCITKALGRSIRTCAAFIDGRPSTTFWCRRQTMNADCLNCRFEAFLLQVTRNAWITRASDSTRKCSRIRQPLDPINCVSSRMWRGGRTPSDNDGGATLRIVPRSVVCFFDDRLVGQTLSEETAGLSHLLLRWAPRFNT